MVGRALLRAHKRDCDPQTGRSMVWGSHSPRYLSIYLHAPPRHLLEQHSASYEHVSPLARHMQAGSLVQSESSQSIPPLQSLSIPSLHHPYSL